MPISSWEGVESEMRGDGEQESCLFGRSGDLVMLQPIKNPYMAKEYTRYH